jgi:4-hydroxybenzoate polyprenyltransferase
MNAAWRLAQALVYTNVVVALAAASLTFATYLFFGIAVSWSVVVLALSSTLWVYTADRLLPLSPEDRVNVPVRVAFVARHRVKLIALSLASAGLSIGCASVLHARTIFVLAALLALVLLYGAPLVRGRRLKSVPALKPALIGLCWAAGSVLVPLVDAGIAIDARALGLVVFRTLFIGAAALAFDVRDAKGDGEASLVTQLGATRALDVCRAALLASLVIACAGVASGVAHVQAMASVIVVLALWAALSRREQLRDDVYLGLVVDGALVLPGALALVLRAVGLTPLW